MELIGFKHHKSMRKQRFQHLKAICMSEKFRLDRKIGFQNTFYTKCINVIFDSIGPSIILRSIYSLLVILHVVKCQYKAT